MNIASAKTPAELERTIESKRTLLAYLNSGAKQMTIESYVCLTGILFRAGWRLENERWQKGDLRLAAIDAAKEELARQIAADKDRLLRQTVKSYRPEVSSGK